MISLLAMREVDTRYVHSGLNQFRDQVPAARTDRTDEFGSIDGPTPSACPHDNGVLYIGANYLIENEDT